MCALRLLLLGGFRAEWDGAAVGAFESDKARALLAYLAMESDRPHRRDALTGLLWPELPQGRARHNLSQTLFSLRRLFPSDPELPLFEVTLQDIRARPESCWIDARELLEMQRACETHLHDASQTCPACTERLERAVALYKGPFLTGLNLKGSAAFDEWLISQRESLQERVMQALGELSRNLELLGDLEKSLCYARYQVELDPLDDAARRQVMSLLAQVGRRPEALSHYDAFRQLLQDELGVEPEGGTTALYHRILAAQVGGPARRTHNLPVSVVPLVGRQQQHDELCSCLTDEGCRLLTVLGGGGSGKTHLALEGGRALLPVFPDGVFLVELTDGQAHETLAFQIARAIGIELPSGAAPQHTLEQRLCSFLADKRVLLIIDGFEVLSGESGVLGDLLRRVSGLKVLATSRVRLNLRAEHVLVLDGLPYPEPTSEAADPSAYAAVQLFVEAARRARPDFVLSGGNAHSIIEICRLVQGMPLGIWLAAAWMDVLEPEQVVNQTCHSLDFLTTAGPDLPDRQRSLRATFDYSLRLLGDAERAAFLRLSAFRGGFSAELARQVGQVDLRTLRLLVDQSLLQPLGEGTFRIHDLLRQYAREQLATDGQEERALRSRHCRVFLTALAAQELRLKTSEAFEALEEIDRQFADITVAWEWAADHAYTALLEQAAWALGHYLELRDRHVEGIALCSKALERLGRGVSAEQAVPLALHLAESLAVCLLRENELERCRQVLGQADALLRDYPDLSADLRRERAFLLIAHGRLLTASGASHLESLHCFEQSLDLLYALEDPWGIGYGLLYMAYGHSDAGNIYECRRYAELGLATQRPSGDPALITMLLGARRDALMLSGEAEAALQTVAERSAYLPHYDDHYHAVILTIERGVALFHAGRYGEARPLLEQAALMFDRPDEWKQHFVCLWLLDLTLLALGDYAAIHLGPDLGGEDRIALDRTEVRFSVPFTWAVLDLLRQDWDMAECNLFVYIDHAREVSRLDMLAGPLGLLALIAFRRGNLRLVRERLLEGLQNGVTQGHLLGTLICLGVLALILAEAGDLERAAETHAAATSHPMTRGSCWFHDVIGAPVERLIAGLPTEVAAAARARGLSTRVAAVAAQALECLRA